MYFQNEIGMAIATTLAIKGLQVFEDLYKMQHEDILA